MQPNTDTRAPRRMSVLGCTLHKCRSSAPPHINVPLVYSSPTLTPTIRPSQRHAARNGPRRIPSRGPPVPSPPVRSRDVAGVGLMRRSRSKAHRTTPQGGRRMVSHAHPRPAPLRSHNRGDSPLMRTPTLRQAIPPTLAAWARRPALKARGPHVAVTAAPPPRPHDRVCISTIAPPRRRRRRGCARLFVTAPNPLNNAST